MPCFTFDYSGPMHTLDKAGVLISGAGVSSVPAEFLVCLGCSFRIQRCKTLLTYTPMVSFLFPGINIMHLFSCHIQFMKRTCIPLHSYTHLLIHAHIYIHTHMYPPFHAVLLLCFISLWVLTTIRRVCCLFSSQNVTTIKKNAVVLLFYFI